MLYAVLLGIAAASGSVRFSSGLFGYVRQHWGGDAVHRVKRWQTFLQRHDQWLARPAVTKPVAAASGVRRPRPSAASGAASAAAAPAVPRRAASAASPAPPASGPAIMALLRATNAFWNRIPYQEDEDTWGDANYMASPIETLGADNADCKAYAIAKYYTLKDLGVPVDRMRLTYVTVAEVDEPHMVLAYYPTPSADPYILDNLVPDVEPASQRPDLVPVYSFNDDDLWTVGVSNPVGSSSQIRVWRDLQRRMAQQNGY